jgi:HSP20 family molecular chaperone IbpA
MAREVAETPKERGSSMPSSPFADMARWQLEMERMFGDFLGGRARPLWDDRWWPGKSLVIREPVVDLYEEKDEVVVKAELFGVTKDDFQINITDHLLTIKKRKEEEVKEQNYYGSERMYRCVYP